MAAQNVRTFVASYGVDSNPCSRTAPCRNFAAAVAETNPAGEVVALDSSGYGPVIIGQSVTIVAPFGVHAAIAPTSGAAVAINVGSFDTVTLRGLYLNSQGASVGIDFDAGRTLRVENCVVSGFSTAGIRVSRDVSVVALNSYSGLDAGTLGTGVAIMRVSNSTIVENSNGIISNGDGASIESRGDNTLERNNASNVFTASYSAK